ncbi:MAG: uroporphyrinogen decarboxylase family protein [Chloroflexota bacterium]
MNTRERFLAVTSFEPVDRTLKWEMGYWSGAMRRWYEEGLPKRAGIPEGLPDGRAMHAEGTLMDPEGGESGRWTAERRDVDVHDYFGLDEPIWRLPLNNYLYPLFEPEVLEDHGEWILHRNEYGVIVKDQKDYSGFPNWEQTPVQTRDDWERIKAERLQPTLEGRLPENWPELVLALKERTYPLMLGGYPTGFYGTARFLLGEERVLTTFLDDPALMHDIMDHLADLWVALYDQVLGQLDVDGCLIWEDMCYKGGPLISPRMFREFMLPGYKKVTACLRDHGISVIMVDTDGDCWQLIPLFIEGGVNLLSPMEVNAKMDVTQVREAFPTLALAGGLDKTRLPLGKDALDRELEKVSFMLKHGRYIPHIDHMVPPDVPWENFCYYRQKLNAIIKENSTT